MTEADPYADLDNHRQPWPPKDYLELAETIVACGASDDIPLTWSQALTVAGRVRGSEWRDQFEARIRSEARDAALVEAREAIHVTRFDVKHGRRTSPDSFYAGVTASKITIDRLRTSSSKGSGDE